MYMKGSTKQTIMLVPVVLLGCRTAAPEFANTVVSLEEKVVQLRMPEEGQHLPVLFWKPKYIFQGDISGSWTGKWIEDVEVPDSANGSGEGALMLVPAAVVLMATSGVHSFVGAVGYKVKGVFVEQEDLSDYSKRITALAKAARAREFESDLKTAFAAQLARHVIVTNQPAKITMDLHITKAGMTGQRPQTRSQDPKQSFELVVRADITLEGGETSSLLLSYKSERKSYREWAADEADQFATVRDAAIKHVARQLKERITSPHSPAPM